MPAHSNGLGHYPDLKELFHLCSLYVKQKVHNMDNRDSMFYYVHSHCLETA